MTRNEAAKRILQAIGVGPSTGKVRSVAGIIEKYERANERAKTERPTPEGYERPEPGFTTLEPLE